MSRTLQAHNGAEQPMQQLSVGEPGQSRAMTLVCQTIREAPLLATPFCLICGAVADA